MQLSLTLHPRRISAPERIEGAVDAKHVRKGSGALKPNVVAPKATVGRSREKKRCDTKIVEIGKREIERWKEWVGGV